MENSVENQKTAIEVKTYCLDSVHDIVNYTIPVLIKDKTEVCRKSGLI